MRRARQRLGRRWSSWLGIVVATASAESSRVKVGGAGSSRASCHSREPDLVLVTWRRKEREAMSTEASTYPSTKVLEPFDVEAAESGSAMWVSQSGLPPCPVGCR
jgi:hypothetical protein